MATAQRQAHQLLLDDDPPAYTPLPLPEEESLDAGAGAPIVRTRPPHLVVNPSDPRSPFTRSYHAQSGGGGSAGPMGAAPRPPARIQAVRIQAPLVQAPLVQAPRPRIHTPRIHAPLVHAPRPLVGAGLEPIRHAALRESTMMCGVCRNSGWLFNRVPCACPAGRARRKAHPRSHPSLLGFIDEMLSPPPPPSVAGPQSAAPDRRTLPYLQHVPGPGTPCPNCLGQSYFRHPAARATAAAEEIRAWHGRTPPPCSVCCDRGRIN
ncbi:hypothetical protein H4R18_004738 [Coemansia javaensis]|uniref:Uncharacterized protein n=1 Tax=Coemansia javaensis TaxID=2761396 RepID=A0A9W8H870_9FUNG|nr:hypothetical protein H4R18_004738 [Coemansia javaensis]